MRCLVLAFVTRFDWITLAAIFDMQSEDLQCYSHPLSLTRADIVLLCNKSLSVWPLGACCQVEVIQWAATNNQCVSSLPLVSGRKRPSMVSPMPHTPADMYIVAAKPGPKIINGYILRETKIKVLSVAMQIEVPMERICRDETAGNIIVYLIA